MALDPGPSLSARRRGAAVGAEIVGVAVGLVGLIGRDPLDLRSRWLGDVDTKYYGWLAWRLAQLNSPTLRLSGVVHPAGLELGLLDGLAPITASGLAVRLFGRYLGLNLVVLAGIVGNYLGARRLATVMGARGGARVMCAAAFAAAPLFSSPASSFPPLLWAFTTPLLLAEVIEVARGDRRLRPMVLAGLLVAAYLCSIYHLVFGGLAAAIIAVSWPSSSFRRRSILRPLAVAATGVLVVLAPFGVARLRYGGDERSAGASPTVMLNDARTFSADAFDVFTLPALAPGGPRVGFGIAERPLERFRLAGLGWVLVAAAPLVLLAPRRTRSDAGTSAGRIGTGIVALSVSAAVLWLLSWGPRLMVAGHQVGGRDWLPYRVLLAVPGLGALRAPYRATIALAAVAVALLAWALASLTNPAARRVVVGALAVLMVLSWWPRLPTSTADVPPGLDAAMRTIADSPAADAVMVVPFTCAFDDLDTMNWQVAHGHPMVTCGVSSSATRWATRAGIWFSSESLAATRCAPEVDVLGRPSVFPAELRLAAAGTSGLGEFRREFGVRWMIFDRARATDCATASATLDALTTRQVVTDDGRFIVFDLSAPAG